MNTKRKKPLACSLFGNFTLPSFAMLLEGNKEFEGQKEKYGPFKYFPRASLYGPVYMELCLLLMLSILS